MKYFATSLATIVGVFVLLLLLLLWTPLPKWVSQAIIDHYVANDLKVTQADFTLHDFILKSRFNEHEYCDVNLSYSLLGAYTLKMTMQSDIAHFSKLSGVTLPHLIVSAKAKLDDGNAYILDLQLLKGNLHAEGALKQNSYSLWAKGLRLEEYFKQQDSMPLYASGGLNFNASGSFETDPDLSLSLHTDGLRFEKPLVKNISSSLDKPLQASFKIHSQMHGKKIDIYLDGKSALVDIQKGHLSFDKVTKAFLCDVILKNDAADKIKIKALTFHVKGIRGERETKAEANVTSDVFNLNISDISLSHTSDKKRAKFTLSSDENSSLLFRDDTHIEGSMVFERERLIVKTKLSRWQKPLVLTYANKKLNVKTDSIPLESVTDVMKRPTYIKSKMAIKGYVDFQKDPAQYHFLLDSKAVELNTSLASKLGILKPFSFESSIDSMGTNLLIKPTITSNIFKISHSKITVMPNHSQLDFSLEANDVNHTYYQTKQLRAKGTLFYKGNLTLKGVVEGDNEKLKISSLVLHENNVLQILGAVAIDKLNRFGPLSSNYALHSDINITRNKNFKIKLNAKELGKHVIKIDTANKVVITSKNIETQALEALADMNHTIDATLNLKAVYENKRLHLNVKTPLLKTATGAPLTLRDTPLEVDAYLRKKDAYYLGNIYVKSDNETLKMKLARLSSKVPYLKSAFSLQVKHLSNTTYPIGLSMQEPLNISNGQIELGKKQQLLHAEVDSFELATPWHQKIDAKATTPLKVNMKMDVHYEDAKLKLMANMHSKLLSLDDLLVNINTHAHDISLKSHASSSHYPKPISLSANGNYMDKTIAQARLKTPYEDLKVSNGSYGDSNYTGTYELVLKDTPKKYPYFHHQALVSGSFMSQPVPTLLASTYSFDGEIHLFMSTKKLSAQLQHVSLVKLINFYEPQAPLLGGVVEGNLSIKGNAFSINKDTLLNGEIQLEARQIEMAGMNVDEDINMLKETQDIAIFKGQIPGISFIGSVLTSPFQLVGFKKKTKINQIYIKSKIVDSNLSCIDCAMKTAENRIAVKGNVLLDQNLSLEAFYVGLLLDNGCAYYKQKIEGSLDAPKIKKIATSFNLLTGTVGAVVDVVSKSVSTLGNLIPGVDEVNKVADEVSPEALRSYRKDTCVPFYTGKVKLN